MVIYDVMSDSAGKWCTQAPSPSLCWSETRGTSRCPSVATSCASTSHRECQRISWSQSRCSRAGSTILEAILQKWTKNIMQKMQRHANASCAIPAAPTGDWQHGLCHLWDQNISARMFFDGHSQTVQFTPCRITFYLGKSRLITWQTWTSLTAPNWHRTNAGVLSDVASQVVSFWPVSNELKLCR